MKDLLQHPKQCVPYGFSRKHQEKYTISNLGSGDGGWFPPRFKSQVTILYSSDTGHAEECAKAVACLGMAKNGSLVSRPSRLVFAQLSAFEATMPKRRLCWQCVLADRQW